MQHKEAWQNHKELEKYIQTQVSFSKEKQDAILSDWDRNDIHLPDWLTPYWNAGVCLRLNHEAGAGCSYASKVSPVIKRSSSSDTLL